MKIRIHSFINEKSLPYFEYMVENYRKMSGNPDEMTFVAYSFAQPTSATLRTMENVSSVVEVYRLPRFFVKQTVRDWAKAVLAMYGVYCRMGGSNGHAAGLNAAFANTGGDAIDVIADTDTVVLKKDWDLLVVEILERHGIVGTAYEDIGGFSSGSGKAQTYKHLPSMTWLALSPRFDFRGFNANPEKRSNLPITDEILSKLYNLPIGYELARDVGWRMPGYLREHGIPVAVFNQVKPTSDAAKAVKSGNDYHEEFQWRGEPIIAHQRGSHQHRFRESELSGAFYDACERYLRVNK